MITDEGQRLKVWRWHGRDRSSLEDLEFVIACRALKAINGATTRLQLPKPKFGFVLVKPGEPGFDLAMDSPGVVFWKSEDSGWLGEDELSGLRARATAMSRMDGRWITPINRPDPTKLP